MKKKILLINGPNLNLLGMREPDIYGSTTLGELVKLVEDKARKREIEISPYQSNHEGDLIDFIQTEYGSADGIIINPGALTHYGYSLRDCLAAVVDIGPIVEVHISDIKNREEWRSHSVITDICSGMICGKGIEGYLEALDYFGEER